MIRSILGRPLRRLRDAAIEIRTARYVERQSKNSRFNTLDDFDFNKFRENILQFVGSLRVDPGNFCFRYSASCGSPTLYASAYACMTCSLLGELKSYSDEEKLAWKEYFDSFQREDDGLFLDPAVMNDIYPDSDWWGARHLSLHMISAYTDLGARPRHPFKFLSQYHNPGYIKNWLDGHDWNGNDLGFGDLDNKIMNIGCLLQYQRDRWNDISAGQAVDCLKHHLLQRINPDTGLWGGFDPLDPNQRSRMIQFAYHILPLFFYDGYFCFDNEKIVELTLRTQNHLGGYGVKINSSACEDIDSADILIRLSSYVSDRHRLEISHSVRKALRWICLNQSEDGGFVFRLNEPFVYGSESTASEANKGAMLSTWFRVLAVSYIAKHLSIDNDFLITRCPGYEY